MSPTRKTVQVHMTMDVPLDVELIAQAFCAMDDEQQAQFFIECAKIAGAWRASDSSTLGAWYQWNLVGAHLRTCECSTDEARQMIQHIAEGIAS